MALWVPSRTPPGEVATTPRALPGRCIDSREGRAALLICTAGVVPTARLLSFPERKLCGELFFLEWAMASKRERSLRWPAPAPKEPVPLA